MSSSGDIGFFTEVQANDDKLAQHGGEDEERVEDPQSLQSPSRSGAEAI